MSTTIIVNARLVTLAGPDGPRRGADLRDLGVIERGWIRIDGETITALGPGEYEPTEDDADLTGELIDASGSVIMPAWVDCHTHACWAGRRFDEFEAQLAGASYLDILQAGGGIMSTVRSVRDAPEDVLLEDLGRRLGRMHALGTGTVEVKSGYGLQTEAELRMLRVIHEAAQVAPQLIVGTFLGAHAKDPGNRDFVDETVTETLPAVISEFPGITVDAYCEQGAWSLEECRRLFEAAADAGCPIRVHADQFNPLGMTRLAIEMGAVSVDHLEASTPEELTMLAESSSFGVMLPASGFHLDDRYGPGRAFIDAGGALAIATNYNPGSAPSPSMPFTIALACRKLKLTPAEAITCATWNGACVLGLQNRVGSLEPGKRADLQMLDAEDEREVAVEFANPGPLMVMLGGRLVHLRGIVESSEDAGDHDHDHDQDHDVDMDP
ncbi:MAG: imidazolonepropionase [Phycisphaerales bacterium]